MSKIKFSDIKLADHAPAPKIIKYNDQEIAVKQWLPIADKEAIIQVTLQESEEGSSYNQTRLDMYFALNLIFKYAEIEFSAEDRLAQDELFDKLNNTGLMKALIDAIPQDEKDFLYGNLIEMRDRNMHQNSTVAGLLKTIFSSWPQYAEQAKDIVESFDPSKWQEVQDFAIAANGGRPLEGMESKNEE